jgi:hypothetical protein
MHESHVLSFLKTHAHIPRVLAHHLTTTDGSVHLLVWKVGRQVLRVDLRRCPQGYSWKTHIDVLSDGGVGISFHPDMGIVRVHITVTCEPPIVKKRNVYYKLWVLTQFTESHRQKKTLTWRSGGKRACSHSLCYAKKLFVENFPDKRPLIPAVCALLQKMAQDRFPQSRISWKVRT